MEPWQVKERGDSEPAGSMWVRGNRERGERCADGRGQRHRCILSDIETMTMIIRYTEDDMSTSDERFFSTESARYFRIVLSDLIARYKGHVGVYVLIGLTGAFLDYDNMIRPFTCYMMVIWGMDVLGVSVGGGDRLKRTALGIALVNYNRWAK
ncbi:hypothetical protein Tco_0454141 [Tanacetum coccineum]